MKISKIAACGKHNRQGEKDTKCNATTSNILTGVDIKVAAEPSINKCNTQANGVCHEGSLHASKQHQQHQQHAPDPQGSRPLLTDPPLQLCLLAEAAQLGCLPGPEAAQLARSPERILRRSRGRTTQARQSADACLSRHPFRALTTKYCKKIQQSEKAEQNVRHARKSARDQGPTNRSTH